MADTRKTSSGFEYQIADGALDDWEVLEALVDIENGHYSAAVKILKLLLGDEQAKQLKEYCRDKKTGRVPKGKMFTELSDILSPKSEEDGSKNA